MQIVLSQQIQDLGINEMDIKCMLKASGKEVLTNVYEPSLQEVNALINLAHTKEQQKQRTVIKWLTIIDELKTLTKV